MTTLLVLLSVAAAAPLPIKGGAGLHFHAGGTFMDQPVENVTDEGYIVPAQGWGGFGGGGGLALEGRFFGFVGLELDVIYRRDVARSTFTFNNAELPFQISQNAWHVPILLKFIMPKGAVRPNIFGGGEFIIPGEPTITQPAGLETPLSASNESYKAWAFGLGFEIVPKGLPIDLRFPITLRGAYNTGVGPTSGDRATYVIDERNSVFESIDYTSVWQWHASATLGVSYFFP